jgi:hypothetical protein
MVVSAGRSLDELGDPVPSFGRDPAMAPLVEPNRGEKFLLAMDMKSARDLGYMLLRTVMRVAPGVLLEEALNGPQGQLLREKLSNGCRLPG